MKLPIANCRLPIASAAQAGSLAPRSLATCAMGTPAGCQPASRSSACQQTASLRYKGWGHSSFVIRHSKLHRAFTLIEIMVVVGIMGLVAAMGLPSIFKALQKEGMRKAVSDIQDVCFSAREQAIVNNKITAVVIIPRERRFGVEGTTAAVNSHSGKTLMATLPEGVELGMLDIYRRDFTQSDWAKIFFNPDGTCDEAVIVLIAKGGAESHKITLEYATGIPVVSSVDR